MKSCFIVLMTAALCQLGLCEEQTEEAPLGIRAGENAPRWLYLGDDEQLERTYRDARRVVIVCVYEVGLEDVRPPFANVVHSATVVKSLRGDLRTAEKIEIDFSTDSLPKDERKRADFIASANEKLRGSLRIAFLPADERNVDGNRRFSTSWVDVPEYSDAMHDFLIELSAQSNGGEQGGADQPATAPESKPEGKEKP